MTRDELDGLVTEARRDGGTADYDLRPTAELVELMNREDASVPAAVAAAAPRLAAAVDAVVERLRDGGRLVYVGAGTSGRLAALDAGECEATFSCPPGQVVAAVAEDTAAEDDAEAGAAALRSLAVGAGDAVVGVSASGRTPYVLGALEAAAAVGALTVAVVAVESSRLGGLAEHEVATVVGPEFVAGSTRLKAGTAQKLVLNAISTISMIRLGKTYGDLMVGVVPDNEKLRARAARVVSLATGVDADAAGRALEAAGGDARVAIVALSADLDPEAARARLDAADGNVRRALSA